MLGHWTDSEIPDPYMGDLAAFERSLNLIEQGIADWLKRLWALDPAVSPDMAHGD